MSKKIIKIYKALIDSAGLELSDDDLVSFKVHQKDGVVKSAPLTIKGKRLVLPTKKQLSNPDWEHRVCFHPLSENPSRGESDVLERYRSALNIRLNAVLPTLCMFLLRLAASPDEHKKLDPDQAEFLPLLKNADQKSLDNFQALLSKMPAGVPTKQMVALFLRRSAKLDGRDYFRAGIVHFPFYAELTKEENRKAGKVLGVDLRKKDFEILINLLDYVIPHQGEANYYSRGSDSRTAPSLDSIMQAYLAVIGPMNDKVELFKNLLGEDTNLYISADWAEDFENLTALIPELREMPMLAGNEGTVPGTETAAPAVVQPVTTVAPVAPAMQPYGQSAPMAAPPAPMHHAYGQPVAQVAPPPVHKPYGQAVAPVPERHTAPSHSGEPAMDMAAFLQNNPAVAQQVGFRPMGMGMGYMPQVPQNPALAGRATLANPVAQPQYPFYQQPQPMGYVQPGYPQPGYAAPQPGYGGNFPPSMSGL